MKRRMKKQRIDVLRDDLKHVVSEDGDTVTFTWEETTGGTYNEVYKVWEGGIKQTIEHKIKGIGKVVDYKQDIMEYEYARIGVGECIVRFPHDVNLAPVMGKEGVHFLYKGEKWKLDSPLGIGDSYNDMFYSLSIKGVKAND
ncbi:hypothetical protein [Microcystis phage MaeS]|nr:hypothetical protein [Microcystis phage MaeS]